jgi:hypothetical protein
MSIINKIQVIQNESIAGANTKERVSDVLTDINNLINSNLTSVNGYINQQIATIPLVNLAPYDTSTQVNAKIASIPPTNLSAYDTSLQVNSKIAAIPNVNLADTSFDQITYAATITRTYNDLIPNAKITLAGNLTYTISGTVNGDSGILELSNCIGRTIELSGLLNIIIVGSTETIVFSFINTGSGVVWMPENINTNSSPAPVETDKANSQGTILYHSTFFENRGSVSVSGNIVTGIDTLFIPEFINSRFTINGNHYIITAVASLTSMTINLTTNEIAENGNWGIFNRAFVILPNGSIRIFGAYGTESSIFLNQNSELRVSNIRSDTNVTSSNDVYLSGELINFRANGGITLKSPNGTSYITRVDDSGVLITTLA